jgi:hypothetical protein
MATIRRTAPAAAVSTSAAAKRTAVSISNLKCADTGLKVKVDAKTQTLTLSGTARGIETRDPYNRDASAAERARTPDYLKTEQFGGTLSFDFDHEKMPKFDTSAGYTEKNKWYFAHAADLGTKKGQTAKQVADALAAKVNASGSYKAVVKSNADGTASLSIGRR